MSGSPIEQRIQFHERELRKNNDKKDILENILNGINEKIIYHTTAIWNLEKKQKQRRRNDRV